MKAGIHTHTHIYAIYIYAHAGYPASGVFTQPRKGKQLKGLRLSAARVPRVVDCAKIGFQLWGGARTLLHCGTCIPSGLQVGTLHANSQHVIAYINAAEYANLLLPAQLRRRKLGQLQQRKKRREKKNMERARTRGNTRREIGKESQNAICLAHEPIKIGAPFANRYCPRKK